MTEFNHTTQTHCNWNPKTTWNFTPFKWMTSLENMNAKVTFNPNLLKMYIEKPHLCCWSMWYRVSHQKEFSELENCFTQLYQIRQLLIQALIVWARFYLHRKKGLHLMITYQRMGNSVLMQQILELKKRSKYLANILLKKKIKTRPEVY